MLIKEEKEILIETLGMIIVVPPLEADVVVMFQLK